MFKYNSNFSSSPNDINIIVRLREPLSKHIPNIKTQFSIYNKARLDRKKIQTQNKKSNLSQQGLYPLVKYTIFTCNQPSGILLISNKPITGESINNTFKTPNDLYDFNKSILKDTSLLQFDKIYNETHSLDTFYNETLKDKISNLFNGKSTCVLFFGPFDGGKSYLLRGSTEQKLNEPGLLSRAIDDIFIITELSKQKNPNSRISNYFVVKLSIYQVYLDIVNDLLSTENNEIKIEKYYTNDNTVRYDLTGMTQREIKNKKEYDTAIKEAVTQRKWLIQVLKVNELRRRSHLVISLKIAKRVKSSNGISISNESSIDNYAQIDFVELVSSNYGLKENIKESDDSVIGKLYKNSSSVLSSICNNIVSASGNLIAKNDTTLTLCLKKTLNSKSSIVFINCITPWEYPLNQSLKVLKYSNWLRNKVKNLKENKEVDIRNKVDDNINLIEEPYRNEKENKNKSENENENENESENENENENVNENENENENEINNNIEMQNKFYQRDDKMGRNNNAINNINYSYSQKENQDTLNRLNYINNNNNYSYSQKDNPNTINRLNIVNNNNNNYSFSQKDNPDTINQLNIVNNNNNYSFSQKDNPDTINRLNIVNNNNNYYSYSQKENPDTINRLNIVNNNNNYYSYSQKENPNTINRINNINNNNYKDNTNNNNIRKIYTLNKKFEEDTYQNQPRLNQIDDYDNRINDRTMKYNINDLSNNTKENPSEYKNNIPKSYIDNNIFSQREQNRYRIPLYSTPGITGKYYQNYNNKNNNTSLAQNSTSIQSIPPLDPKNIQDIQYNNNNYYSSNEESENFYIRERAKQKYKSPEFSSRNIPRTLTSYISTKNLNRPKIQLSPERRIDNIMYQDPPTKAQKIQNLEDSLKQLQEKSDKITKRIESIRMDRNKFILDESKISHQGTPNVTVTYLPDFEIEKLKQDQETLKNDNIIFREDINRLTDINKHLEDELTIQRGKTLELAGENEKIIQEKKKLEEEIGKCKEEIEKSKINEKNLVESFNERLTTEKRVNDAESELCKLKEEKIMNEVEYRVLMEKFNELKKNYDTLNCSLVNTQETHESEIWKIENKVNVLTREIEKLQKENAIMRLNDEKQKKEIFTLGKIRDNYKEKYQEQKSNNNLLSSKLNEIELEFKNIISEKENKNNIKKREEELKRMKLDSKVKVINELQNKITNFRNERIKKKNEDI